MHRIVPLALAFALIAPAAYAGTLGDFGDSIDRDNGSSDRDSGGSDDDDDDSHYSDDCDDTWDDCDEDWTMWAYIVSKVITGYVPRDRFSFGSSPFDGRGYAPGWDALASNGDLSSLSIAAPPDARHGHGMIRLNGLGLRDGTAFGFGLDGRIESSFTPGLRLGVDQLYDRQADESLGRFQVALEPRLWVDRWVTLTYALGFSTWWNHDGHLNRGMLIGAGLTAYPIQPLMLEVRISADILGGVTLSDLSGTLGVQLVRSFFAYTGYRHIGGTDVPLGMVTLGVGFDAGF